MESISTSSLLSCHTSREESLLRFTLLWYMSPFLSPSPERQIRTEFILVMVGASLTYWKLYPGLIDMLWKNLLCRSKIANTVIITSFFQRPKPNAFILYLSNNSGRRKGREKVKVRDKHQCKKKRTFGLWILLSVQLINLILNTFSLPFPSLSISHLILMSFLQNGETSEGDFKWLGMFLCHFNYLINYNLVVRPLFWHTADVLYKKWEEHLISKLLAFCKMEIVLNK